MTKGRLEAFSDGVIAITITTMVLEMKVPRGEDLAALRLCVPKIRLGIESRNRRGKLTA